MPDLLAIPGIDLQDSMIPLRSGIGNRSAARAGPPGLEIRKG